MVQRAKSQPSQTRRMADAIERLRRDRETVYDRDLIALGFTAAEIAAFGDDARALHAQTHPQAVAA